MKLSEALKELSSKLEKEKIPVILIGGFAVNHYGASRLTVDIDFLMSKPDFTKASVLLKEEGFDLSEKTDLFARLKKENLPLKTFDFVFVDPQTFESVYKGGKEIEMAGIKFHVPSLNHLIALKLHAIKNNRDHRISKDLPDIIELIKKNQVNAQSEEFKSLCEKYGPTNFYSEIIKLL